MKLTAKELTRILNQPGYAIADGSLIDPVTPQNAVGVCFGGDPGQSVQNDKKSAPRPFTSVWRNEREFQRAVVDAYAAWAAINKESAILCHVANENAHKQPGIVAGMPDLVLFAGAERGSLFIELKAGSGKLSTAQRETHYRLQRLGYRVITIWDSVEEALREIEEFLKGEMSDTPR